MVLTGLVLVLLQTGLLASSSSKSRAVSTLVLLLNRVGAHAFRTGFVGGSGFKPGFGLGGFRDTATRQEIFF